MSVCNQVFCGKEESVILRYVFFLRFFKTFLSLLLLVLAICTLNAVEIEGLIASKFQSCGVLTFTQKELSKSLLAGLIDKEKSFTLTNLENREKVIGVIEELLKKKQQKYKLEKKKRAEITKMIMGYWIGSAINKAVSYAKNLLKRDIQWLIIESQDQRILDVVFVKDIKNKNN